MSYTLAKDRAQPVLRNLYRRNHAATGISLHVVYFKPVIDKYLGE